MTLLVPTSNAVQPPLFIIEKQAIIDGVEMGVLENGMPYLTESGLARMCGIDRKALNRLAINWNDEKYKPRGKQINQLLKENAYFEDGLYLDSVHNGKKVNAYTEPVCLAILEFYAFVAPDKRDQAIRAFRSLARTTFKAFIYASVGYSPEHKELDKWKHFHDRISLTQKAPPAGYWGVFKEIAGMIVPLINSGVIISDKVVPDISVGITWSNYWKKHNLDSKYGPRQKYDHCYPDYYPQAKTNPQPAYAYPNAALGEFRSWLEENYILKSLPRYLIKQATNQVIPASVAAQALEALGVNELEYKPYLRIA